MRCSSAAAGDAVGVDAVSRHPLSTLTTTTDTAGPPSPHEREYQLNYSRTDGVVVDFGSNELYEFAPAVRLLYSEPARLSS